jgi:hypothetical protein
VNKVFEQIACIRGMVAAAFVAGDGKLAGWCANSAISPENLSFVAGTCRAILAASRGEERVASLGAVAFGDRTLVFREGTAGLFLAYLDSPTDEAVLSWLFAQVDPLLAGQGISFRSVEEA